MGQALSNGESLHFGGSVGEARAAEHKRSASKRMIFFGVDLMLE
jgi:hypothetical protein